MREWADVILRGARALLEMGLHNYNGFHDIAISGGGEMFLEVLYRSMIAGGIVLVILLLRVLFKRVPKIYCYLLWGLVLYRLLCPFTLVSSCSFLGIFDRMDVGRIQNVETGELSKTESVEELQTEQMTPVDAEGADIGGVDAGMVSLSGSGYVILWVSTHIWIAGVIVMLLYGAVSLFRLLCRLKGAVRVRENIYLSDYVQTPFVIGILRPRIYLPSSLEEMEWEYIILHERMHIRRGDHIIRMAAFLALAVYWFQPLIWVAYYLSGKDMEMSCDEAVMRKIGKDIRADYAASLLRLSTGRLFSAGTPLAFGEKDVKKRIENVMRWHRSKPVVVGVALAAVAAAVVILGTDPMPQRGEQELRQAAEAWAQATCDRDGGRIVSLCTEEKREALENEELLAGEEGNYSFGWSSPWPLDAQKDYRIVKCTQQETVILYYAWTSDPHVTVWQEQLIWRQEGAEYLVAESSIRYMDSLSDRDSYLMAYGEGINGTPMDYLTNGAGEALYANALQNGPDGRYYEGLFTPQTAARILLNLSEDEEKVIVRAGNVEADGSVTVSVDFPGEGAGVEVKMIRLYGEDGPWVPQD